MIPNVDSHGIAQQIAQKAQYLHGGISALTMLYQLINDGEATTNEQILSLIIKMLENANSHLDKLAENERILVQLARIKTHLTTVTPSNASTKTVASTLMALKSLMMDKRENKQ